MKYGVLDKKMNTEVAGSKIYHLFVKLSRNKLFSLVVVMISFVICMTGTSLLTYSHAADIVCHLSPCLGSSQNDNLIAICFGQINGTTVQANEGNDTINGSNCNDTLMGNKGNDIIIGNAGSDDMTGGGGNDIINASLNDNAIDTLKGNTGNDTFICFNHKFDHVTDYKAGTDTIVGNCGLSAPKKQR